MKTCTKCGEAKDFSEFYKQSRSKDGHHSSCKDCLKEIIKKTSKSPMMQLEKAVRTSIRAENRLLFKEDKRLCGSCRNIFLIADLVGYYCKNCSHNIRREYYEKNIEKVNKQNREYYEKNIEKEKEKKKQYREENKEKIREIHKKYYKENKEKIIKYQKENKEKIIKKSKEYYEKNIEKIKEKNKKYQKENKEKLNEYKRQRYHKQKEGK